MNYVKIPSVSWTLFSQLLYSNLDARLTKTSADYVKSITESGGTITVTKGDNSTSTISGGGGTTAVATTSTNGLMSATDKTKLDNIWIS